MLLRRSLVLSVIIAIAVTAVLPGFPIRTVQAAPLASLPVSDAFGYSANSASLIVLDVCTSGTTVSVDGEGFSADINPAGFSFPFYEKTKTSLRVSINGLINLTGATEGVSEHVRMPADILPNGLVAPFWSDLELSGGQICYQEVTGQYLAVEWKDVELFPSSTPFTFQALLYQNGDIQFQYLTGMPESTNATVGIEDEKGIFGLPIYYNESGVTADSAIRITYPAAANRAATRFVPMFQSGFLIQHEVSLPITLQNITTGATQFELDLNDTASGCGWNLPSGWEVTIYNGGSPLSKSSGCPRTPQIAKDSTLALTVLIRAPQDADVGTYQLFDLTALPVGATALAVTMKLQAAVPASFAQGYKDPNQAINLNQISKNGSRISPAGDLLYYGSNLSMVQTSAKNYFYVWEYSRGNSTLNGSLLGPDGSAIMRDVNITSQTLANDQYPTLAALPNGSTAVLWTRGVNQLYMRIYSASGTPLVAEKNLQTSSCPSIAFSQIAAISNSKFLVVWDCGISNRDIYLNVVDFSNNKISDQLVKITASNTSYEYYFPQIIALRNGTALISYIRNQKANGKIDPFCFRIYSASGTQVQGETRLAADAAIPAQKIERDMIQLSSGVVLTAWTNATTGDVQYSILRGSTNDWLPDGVQDIPIDYQVGAEKLSVTADFDNHGIITWLEAKKNSTLNYALIGDIGNGVYDYITPAMSFMKGANNVTLDTSSTGQGNDPYDPRFLLFIPTVQR